VTPRPRLLLFARAPVIGRVKTRLEPVLGRAGTLAFYRALLADAARAYRDPSWEPVLMAEPDPEDPDLAALFPDPWSRRAQGPGDLGRRLTAAFTEAFEQGAPAAVAVGSDHPLLSRGSLAAALEGAGRRGAAIVPAQDGGYCAIALSKAVAPQEIFSGIPWSSGEVLGATLARFARAGISPATLAPSYDVDRPLDLERLRRDLGRLDPASPEFPAETARVLSSLATMESA
jgi:rSAM/selenodomain-associated transferase 1